MKPSQKTFLPFGTWPSQVSAGIVSQRVRLEDVQWAADGETLVWSEGRSDITVLIGQKGSSTRLELTDEQTPRGGVGFGGGSFTLAPRSNLLIFANRDGRLYRRSFGSERPQPITPAFGPDPEGAVASPAVSYDERWVAYIFSDSRTDLIGLVDSQGAEWPIQLAHGADFYMQPNWHPDGDRLAWVEWDHPNMPWDGTRICLAHLQGTPPKVVQVEIRSGWKGDPGTTAGLLAGWPLVMLDRRKCRMAGTCPAGSCHRAISKAGSGRWIRVFPSCLGAGRSIDWLEPRQPACVLYSISWSNSQPLDGKYPNDHCYSN